MNLAACMKGVSAPNFLRARRVVSLNLHSTHVVTSEVKGTAQHVSAS